MDKNNIKLIGLEEEIFKAIQEGALDSKLSTLRLKAVEVGISQEDLAMLIRKCQKRAARSEGAMNVIAENKAIILISILVLCGAEWGAGIKMGWGIPVILIANFVSALAVVLLAATFIRKKI